MFKITLSDIENLSITNQKVTITVKGNQSFIFDIQIEHIENHMKFQEEAKAYKQFLKLFQKKL